MWFMSSRERMLAACRNEPLDRPPVWIMRQAGRHLPEYLDLRKQHSFWEILKSPKLALEVASQPLRRYQLDAAIVFSDILVLIDAMGGGVEYRDTGPIITAPFKTVADLRRLEATNVEDELDYVGEAVQRLSNAVHPDMAVIGFSGAPLTLGAYYFEGGPKKSLRGLKGLYYRDPRMAQAFLQGIADKATDLLLMQIRAGCDVVQIFDSWSGYLSPEDYLNLAVPPLQRMVDRLRNESVPIILYVRGAASHLESAALTGCDVISIDSSLSLNDARCRLARPWSLQGNLDPAELLGPPERVRERVRAMISSGGHQGLIVNLGQGLTPDIPIEGVESFVNAAREYRRVEGHQGEWRNRAC